MTDELKEKIDWLQTENESLDKMCDAYVSELELHRADYQACKDAGFECPGELLSAYRTLEADNAALRQILQEAYYDAVDFGPLTQEIVTKVAAEHPGADLLRERDELRAEVERLRRLLSGTVVYDTSAAASEQAIHKRLVEMGWTPPNGKPGWANPEGMRNSNTSGEPTGWRTHDSRKPPANLAPVQIIEVQNPAGLIITDCKVCIVDWNPGLRYRPVLSDSGLPLVSAEGLEPWATHVAKDPDGRTFQYSKPPEISEEDRLWCYLSGDADLAPATHAKPGPWTDSLMEVAR